MLSGVDRVREFLMYNVISQTHECHSFVLFLRDKFFYLSSF